MYCRNETQGKIRHFQYILIDRHTNRNIYELQIAWFCNKNTNKLEFLDYDASYTQNVFEV
jgi:hypothetical protein